MTPYTHTPNEIRRSLRETPNWVDGVAEGNQEKFTEAYIRVIGQMVQDRKQIITGFQKRQKALTLFTYVSGTIGVGSAIGATILYAINRKKASDNEDLFSEQHTIASFILSVATGTFIFLAGCGQLITEYARYDKRALKFTNEVRLLEILKRFIISAKSDTTGMLEYAQSTGYFSKIEQEIFGEANLDEDGSV